MDVIGGFEGTLMRLRKRLTQLLILLLLAAAGYWVQSKRPFSRGDEITVVGVIDGDTVELEDGRRVRLIGIDTPERGDIDADSATSLTERLVLRKSVRLEFDRDQKDRYGRTLAFLWVDDQLVNREIIREGWAWCYFFDGNLRHSRELLLAQHEAMEARRGHWKKPQEETAKYYRASFNSFRFHRPECESMNKVDPELEVVFHAKDSAFYDGYAPCGKCMP